MEEQFIRFICLTYQGKQNGSVLSTNNQCMEQLERTQILPMQNVWAAQQISLKIILTIDCRNRETIYMINLYNLPRGA